MNIRTRLYTLAGIPLLGLLTMFVVALVVIMGLKQAADEIHTVSFRSLVVVADVVERFEAQKALLGRTPAETDLTKVARYRSEFVARGDEIERLVGDYIKSSSDADTVTRMTAIKADFQAYKKEAPAVFTAAEAFAQETAVNALNGPVANVEKKLHVALTDMKRLAQEGAQKKVSGINDRASFARTMLIVLFAFLVVGAAAAAHKMTAAIVQPLTSLQGLIGDVASTGNLSTRADIHSSDEVGQTAKSFNDLMSTLQSAFRDILDSVGSVSDVAHTLSVSSDHVAASSAQQSDAATAMAATVEQVSVSITHISGSAREALNISRKSGELSGQGGTIHAAATKMTQLADSVRQTATTIEALGNQSNQISSVVQVIKDVADQTNLLALNAAIEAARAGEMGRGFAVVADEVRKLAERTTKATEEITSMIDTVQGSARSAVARMGDVMNQANEGVSLAQQAGSVVNQIKDGSDRAINLAEDISIALTEQSSASNAIATHVEEVSQMSEESSVAATKTASAAKQLEQLTGTMRAAVNRFKI